MTTRNFARWFWALSVANQGLILKEVLQNQGIGVNTELGEADGSQIRVSLKIMRFFFHPNPNTSVCTVTVPIPPEVTKETASSVQALKLVLFGGRKVIQLEY